MQGILLDLRVSVYRPVRAGTGATAKYTETLIAPQVPAAIVPVSKQDTYTAYAHESTHIIWVPYWLFLQKEDQVRQGRADPDPLGVASPQPRIYTVTGRREFRMGIPQVAYYAKELD